MILEINRDLKFLRKKSESVKKFDADLKTLIADMEETMNIVNGVGLAAPQVGILKRVIVIKIGEDKVAMINPSMVSKDKVKDTVEEGCLSIYECFLNIKRWSKIKVNALDSEGRKIEMELAGLPARIFQHELDHLNGILIIDKVPLIEKIKNLFKR